MRYQDYFTVEREGMCETPDGRKFRYKRIAVPRSKIIAYVPEVSQKKISKIVPRGCDLNILYNLLIREFHQYLRMKPKEDLQPVEHVGIVEVLGGLRFVLEGRRLPDKINQGNHSLIMNKNYQLMVAETGS